MNTPLDLHEWISFEDDTEHRTWMFDATFLRSNWTCIFGEGCKGVHDDDTTHLQQGCCSFGAHFSDAEDISTTLGYVGRLKKRHWQFHKQGRRDGVLTTDDEGVTTTRLVDDACIFLNRPDFEAGAGCAFHVAAVEAGERFIDWKPDVCWQLPLRLEHSTDDSGHLTSALREWKRRDWGAGGSEFHWWCTDAPDAFVGEHPVYRYLRDEIVEMVGQENYDRIVALLERPQWTPVPHPSVRT
jgi:hypothetical protein